MILDRLLRDERGATAIEYGLIVALIAIVMVAALQATGNTLSDTMDEARVGMAN
jgi:pilus assembly protein Flp/PilA